MKKLIYLIGLTLLSSCMLVSCKKTNDVQPTSNATHGWYLISGISPDADSIVITPKQVNKIINGSQQLDFIIYDYTATSFKFRNLVTYDNCIFKAYGNIVNGVLNIEEGRVFLTDTTTALQFAHTAIYHSF